MRLRVLYVIPSLEKGGAEKMVLDISRQLMSGYMAEVCIVTIYPQNEFTSLSNGLNIINCNPVIRTSILHKSLIDISGFNKIVADFKPNVIHSHLYEAEILSRWHILPGIKYFTHCHKSNKQFKKLSLSTITNKENITDYFERRFLINRYRQCSNNFIAVSNGTFSYYRDNLPKDIQSIVLMHNAIDFRFFNRNIKQRILEESKPLKLITAGSLIEGKNQSFLIDVIEKLIFWGSNVHLDIIGEGHCREELTKIIEKKNLGNHISLIGMVHNIGDYYHAADIYIHASLWESFCLSMLEANACGLPVICIDGKGNRDILVDGYNGFMFAQPNTELFAQKILHLTSNHDLYKAISANAVQFASKFNIENYVEKLMELYEKGKSK